MKKKSPAVSHGTWILVPMITSNCYNRIMPFFNSFSLALTLSHCYQLAELFQIYRLPPHSHCQDLRPHACYLGTNVNNPTHTLVQAIVSVVECCESIWICLVRIIIACQTKSLLMALCVEHQERMRTCMPHTFHQHTFDYCAVWASFYRDGHALAHSQSKVENDVRQALGA